MAEISFFMNYEDNIAFLRFLFDKFQPVFTEDNVIDQPPRPRQSFDSISELFQSRDLFPRFFVTSPLWTVHPLSISNVNAVDGKVHWYVNQRYGGPAFDFIPSRKVSINNQTWIVPGSFDDYPWYYIKKSSPDTFDRPASMHQAFKEVQKYIRSVSIRSVCRELQKTGHWIARGAASEYAKGVWLRQGDFHFDPKSSQQKQLQ